MTVTRRLAAAGAGLSAVATVLFTAPAAHAASVSYTTTTDPVQAAAGWVATQFENTTHLPAPNGDHFDNKSGPGYYANYGENADVIFGLAAAKASTSKIDTALTYLKNNLDAYTDITNSDGYGPYDGSLGKLAVAAEVAGADPTSFGGKNLLATLATDECTAATASCPAPGAAANIYSSISESFVILAEARAGGSHAPTANALDYLDSLQCANGGFTNGVTACGTGTADIDATSYAIMALAAAGATQATHLADAATYLVSQQKSGGYWVSQNIPNANSTGLAAAALAGEHVDVSKARSWLRSQQVGRGSAGAGAIKYGGTLTATTTSSTSTSVSATAQALTGLADNGSLATLTAAGAKDAVTMYAPTAKLSSATAKPGASQSVTAHGFVPGEKVNVVVHSSPTTVATATADPLGSVSAKYTLPKSLSAGKHSVVLTGVTSKLTATDPLTVPAAAAPSSSSPASSSDSNSTGSGGSGSDGSTGSSTTASGTNAGSLASTGTDSAQLLTFGALAVLVGFGLIVVGRRRDAVVQSVRAVAGRHRGHR